MTPRVYLSHTSPRKGALCWQVIGKPSLGFTLVELVVVIVVLAILAVTAVPKFASRSTFDQVGFRDQVLSSLQYARKIAVASRRYVCVNANSAGLSLQRDPRLPETVTAAPPVNCTTSLNLPAQNGNSIATPSGVTFSPSVGNINFDPLGRASVTATFAVSGQTIRVEQETGYVH